MKPIFARSTCEPGEVAEQLVGLLADPALTSGRGYFATRTGRFPMAEYVADPTRQQAVLAVSLALADQALSHPASGQQPH